MENKSIINQKALLQELACIMKDEFVATFYEQVNGIEIKFLNGQKFLVTVKEV
jgi:flagellar biosynthesis/type III secretory pathway chaperone